MAVKEKSVYVQVKEKALPLMEGFQTDLTKHDRRDIQQNTGVPFIHYTRKLGTDICFMVPAGDYPPEGQRVPYLFGTADRHHLLDQKVATTTYFTNPYNDSQLVLYFDGETVKEISKEQAVEVVRKYSWRIKGEWRQANHG